MKDLIQGIWGLMVLAGIAVFMGWIDVPKPVMAVLADFNGNSPDRFGGLVKAMPANQAMLVGVVESARERYRAGANDMAKGSVRIDRREEICAIIKTYTDGEWVGFIDELSTNGDGLGVLSIKIAPNVTVGTWNNALSDIGDGTLIDPKSAVYKTAIGMKVGNVVKFTGQFIEDSTDCIKESSLTMDGSMEEPDFVVKFNSLAPSHLN